MNLNILRAVFDCKPWYHLECIASYYNIKHELETYKTIKAGDKWYCDIEGKCVFKRGGE